MRFSIRGWFDWVRKRLWDFQFSLWDSEKIWGMVHVANRNFQFSLWDSAFVDFPRRPLAVPLFQFSLWDSLLEMLSNPRGQHYLSILFMRFWWTVGKLCCQLVVRLSILFMRFGARNSFEAGKIIADLSILFMRFIRKPQAKTKRAWLSILFMRFWLR